MEKKSNHHRSTNNNSAASSNNNAGGGGGGGSAGGSNKNQANNQQLTEQQQQNNLVELFAAHNLLAAQQQQQQNNPLAAMLQQQNYAASNPAAAWWYLEYLSRIQAAQILPQQAVAAAAAAAAQQQNSSGPSSNQPSSSNSGGAGGSSGRSTRGKDTKLNSHNNSMAQQKASIKLPPDTDLIRMKTNTNSSASSSRKKPGKMTQPQQMNAGGKQSAGALHNLLPPTSFSLPPTSSSASLSALVADPVNLTNSRLPNNFSAHGGTKAKTNNAASHHGRHNLEPPHPANFAASAGSAGSSSQQHLPHSLQQLSDPKATNLTIIPHAHSTPDNLTCPRFPADYVPKPAHTVKPILYSHTVPKKPQVGLVKEQLLMMKGKKSKTTVASLLAMSRIEGSNPSASGGQSSSKFGYQRNNTPSPSSASGGALQKPGSRQRGGSIGSRSGGRGTPPASRQKPSSTPPITITPTNTPNQKQQSPHHRPWVNSTTELNIPTIKKSTKEEKKEPDLNAPMKSGWARETILKGLGVQGLSGEVQYKAPDGTIVHTLGELKKYNVNVKNFNFSSKLLIGDFLLPNEKGDQLRLTSNQLAQWLSEEGKEREREAEEAERKKQMEKDRKKEHGNLIKSLELYRRSNRRVKLAQERRLKKQQEALAAAEIQILKPLPSLQPIKGLYLSPQAFANSLQIYEFIYTFGTPLGFEMNSLPTLSTIQKSLLHVEEAEEELFNVVSHLLICAVEDPGMPNPTKHLTPFGQTLKQADITFGSLSEVLRLYLDAVSDSEPEAEKYSEWLLKVPFSALNPTRKSSIITFLCDLLLQNKAVLKYLESSSELGHASKKERVQSEIKIRKLRMLCARKSVSFNTSGAPLTPSSSSTPLKANATDDDSNMDDRSEIRRLEGEAPIINLNPIMDDIKPKKDEPNAEEKAKDDTKEETEANADKEKKEEDSAAGKENTPSVIVSVPSENGKEEETKEDQDEKSDLKIVPIVVPKAEPMDTDNESSVSISVTPNTSAAFNCSTTMDDSVKMENGMLEPPKIEGLHPDYSASNTANNSITQADSDSELSDSSSSSSDSDAKLSVEEIKVKMNDLNKSIEKLRQQQHVSTQVIRTECLGIDRFRRRYWNLPNSGGIYVEGGASGEIQDDVREKIKLKFVELKNMEKANAVTKEEKVETKEAEEEDQSDQPAPKKRKKKTSSDEDEETKEKEAEDKVETEVKPEVPEIPAPEEAKPVKEVFHVPPPVLKIFSFGPRDPCSGKSIEAEEEKIETEDDRFIREIQPENWNHWWNIATKLQLDEFKPEIAASTLPEEQSLATALNPISGMCLYTKNLEDDEDSELTQVDSPPEGYDPELVYKVHMQLLESLETLEERVASASLQVKGYQVPSKPHGDPTEEEIIQLVKTRLLDLEAAVERRYLKPPLGRSLTDINLIAEITAAAAAASAAAATAAAEAATAASEAAANTSGDGTTTTPSGPSSSANSSLSGDEPIVTSKSSIPRALLHWRDALSKTSTPSVLSMAIYTLDSSIAWDKSVMKASCQLCKNGDHEDKLLLCDACDRGYHTYCFNPPLDDVPDGSWFCYECINKATGIKACIVCGKSNGKILACEKCVKAFHAECLAKDGMSAQGLPPVATAKSGKQLRGKWHCFEHRVNTKSPKSKRKSEDSPGAGHSKKKKKNEMLWCERLLDDLASHEDAWPFVDPVNTRQFPTYKKIIKTPMDLATIRTKLPTYKTKDMFLQDVKLIFDNCLTFNEDDSPVGKAGHNLRVFFDSKCSKVV